MKKWKVVIPVLVIVLFVAWYAFRPERLVVNRHVQEQLPTAQGSSPDQTLASGTFHGVVHPTDGTATICRLAQTTRDGQGVLLVEFHAKGGPLTYTAQDHAAFVEAFFRIAQDRLALEGASEADVVKSMQTKN